MQIKDSKYYIDSNYELVYILYKINKVKLYNGEVRDIYQGFKAVPPQKGVKDFNPEVFFFEDGSQAVKLVDVGRFDEAENSDYRIIENDNPIIKINKNFIRTTKENGDGYEVIEREDVKSHRILKDNVLQITMKNGEKKKVNLGSEAKAKQVSKYLKF